MLRSTCTAYLVTLNSASLAISVVFMIIPISGFTYLSSALQKSDHHLESLLGFRAAAILFYVLQRR